MSDNTKRLVAGGFSELAGIGALALLIYYLSITDVARISDVWAVDRVVAYLLMFVGPLLIFLPLSLALRLGPLPVLGAGSWALLGYVLIFVGAPGRKDAGFFTYAAFLGIVFVALATVLAVPLGALSKRLLPGVSPTVGTIRALRQGALLSLFVVSLMAMSPLGVLNWLNALLVFTIAALTEFFFLARD
ncbi:MAG: hypothetical protein ABI670_02855 [Chloroflexota bacterium]